MRDSEAEPGDPGDPGAPASEAGFQPSPFRAPGLAGRWLSFRHAFRGLAFLVRTQPNAKVHALAAGAVAAAGIWLRFRPWEWAAAALAMAAVLAAEALNTAVEFLADAAMPEYHPLIGRAKDVAAAAVLLASFGALGVAGALFLPRFAAWLGG